ncbi:hypothetical protein IWQ62_002029 [Dispira parvispora]|uniref:Thioredoxin domain-containing protein n=1 Tax=Dispira parvispora TaxID=1520584 RepID=A0A9W8AR93_9FUNG|nr:hypothetical protein IWQ62_002029 [Dispira parvispora]
MSNTTSNTGAAPKVELGTVNVFTGGNLQALFDEYIVVVYFTATWCGPCRMISPVVDSLAKEYPDICFVKVDVDKHSELSSEFGVRAMPTFKFVKKAEGGTPEIETEMGASPPNLKKGVETLAQSSQELIAQKKAKREASA